MPEPAPEPIENLFMPEEAVSGWIKGEGIKAETPAFCTTPLLYVVPGDVITFGAAVPSQGWHVVLLDFSEEYRGSATNGSGLTLTEAIDDERVIFSYTVPEGIGYLRLVCDTKYRDRYLITKNRPFTAREFRDYFGMGINDNVSASAVTGIAPVGVISDSFDPSSFDKTTFAGALEEIFRYAKNTWKDAKVGYIITFRMPRYAGCGKLRDMEEYWQTALEICEKWDVSCLDLYHDAHLNDELLAVKTDRCSPDGVHPNAKGYEVLAPVIAEWMEGMA